MYSQLIFTPHHMLTQVLNISATYKLLWNEYKMSLPKFSENYRYECCRWVTPAGEVAWLPAVPSVTTEPLLGAAGHASSHPPPAAAQQILPRPRPRQTRAQLPGPTANSGLGTRRVQGRFRLFTQAPDIYFVFLPSSFLHNPSQVVFDLHFLEVWSEVI